MKNELYFSQFKLPKRANHFWHLIHESQNGRLYYIHTSGVVGVVYKNGKEKLLKGTLHHNKDLIVKIGYKQFKMKNLVAREIFEDYIEGKHSVVLIDGNPRNCDCYNMRIYTKQELGELTGILAKRKQQTTVNGVVYPSVRQAAKDLYVSYQTVLDYVNKKSKKSILENQKIKIEK